MSSAFGDGDIAYDIKVVAAATIALFTDVTEDRSAEKSIDEIDREIRQRIAEIEAKRKVKH